MLKFALLLALTLSALLSACGGKSDTSTPTPTLTPTPTTVATPAQLTATRITVEPTTPPPPPCEDPNLEISVKGDALQFDKDRLEVAAGSEVVLCFSNGSRLSQHNWVMVRSGTKDDVALRGLEAGPNHDWVQPEDPDVIAHTRLVNPGERGEVRFTVPPAGSYQFVCTFPGHAPLVADYGCHPW